MEDPQEISEILSDCLYLSGIQALQDIDTLKHLGITVLFNLSTIDHRDPPLPHNIQYYKFDILDSVDQNITVIMKQIYDIFETQCLSTRVNDDDDDDDDDDDIDSSDNNHNPTLSGKSKGKALMYCQQGISRSATVAIFCVMKSSLFTFSQSQGTLSIVGTNEQHPAAFTDTSSISDSHLLSTSTPSSSSQKLQLQLPMSLKASFQLVKSKRRVILPNTGFIRQLLTAERELLFMLLLKSSNVNKDDDDYNVKLEMNEEEQHIIENNKIIDSAVSLTIGPHGQLYWK